MPKNRHGFAHVLVIIAFFVIIAAGAFFLVSSIKTPTQEIKIPDKISSQRVTGNAKVLPEDEGIDTPRYKESFVSLPIGKYGGVVTLNLKKGGSAYLTIPKDTVNGSLAELSEFSQMPTSETHVPLYEDLGYGVNVAFTDIDGLPNPVFLVFDFSNGKRLEEFKKLDESLINYCDYSKAYFSPEICQALIGIPASQTLGKKYAAVSPKNALDGRTPTFPLYSYYLGVDDILVLRIDLFNESSVIAVPQPLSRELATDIVNSTFGKYSVEYEEYEAFGLTEKLELSLPEDILGTMVVHDLEFYDFKSYFAGKYLEGVVKNPQDLEYLREKNLEGAENLLLFFSRVSGETVQDSESAANLRKAVKAGLPGALEAKSKLLDKITAGLKDQDFQDYELVHAVESVFVLTNGLNYKTSNQSSSILDLFIKPTLAQNTNEDEEAQRVAREEAKEEIDRVLSEETTSVDELYNAFSLADAISDEGAKEEIKVKTEAELNNEIENATDSATLYRLAKECTFWGYDDVEGSLCHELVQSVLADVEGRCHDILWGNKNALEDIIKKSKGLRDFGKNEVNDLYETCKNLLYKDGFDIAGEKGYPIPQAPKLPPFPNQ